MALLDRFRTQSRQKHPDPAVRLAFVEELPLEERELLEAMAREDEDPRVRRAAVGKLLDPGVLGAIAREDADEGVRADATAMLRDIASEEFEGIGEAESLEAVDSLADPRAIAQVARSEVREIVALRAVSRIADVHTLGSIARHAHVEAARRSAFEQLRDRGEHAELLAIALNGEFKDTAVAAAELVTDRDELEQIAARAKNKGAVKRARGVLREAEERAAAAKAETERAAREALAQAAAEAAAAERTARDAERAAREAEALAARQQVRNEADAVAHAEDAHQPAAGDDAEAGARADAERAQTEELARERAERDEADRARRAAEADEQANREAAARENDARVRREALTRLQQLASRVEALTGKEDLSLKAGERALRDLRTALADVPPLPSRQDYEQISGRLTAAQAALTPKVQELREAAEWRQWANVGLQEQLIVRMEALRAVDDPERIARDVRELQQQWRQAADVPRDRADALWRRFKAAHDEVWSKCEAQFAADAQARAENLARKIALCEKAEALSESTDWIQTADAIKQLQAEWKTIGAVSRGREKAVWERFRSACDRFFTRRHEDLARRKTVWAENFARKEALCVQAEALAESNDWEHAASELKRLQGEWKTIGPVKKNRSEAIWQRFRAASDRFFLRYAQRHEVARAERVAAREAICSELESLAAWTPEAPGADGSAPSAEFSDATPEATPGTAPMSQDTPPDLVPRVRSLRSRWQQEIAARGVDPDRARALDARFSSAFASVARRWPAAFGGSELDPEANRRRMESLVRRIEDVAASLGGPAAAADANASPTTRLAAMLKEALAANTIGGKADDDSRWRAAADEVRQAQANWSRIGPVPDDTRRALLDRFQRACRTISERTGAAGRSGAPGRGPGRSGGGGRPGGAGGPGGSGGSDR
jgi:hypothetical protein